MSDTPLEATDRSTAVSLWQVVVSAIRGEHRDYTTETLNRAVILLAIPMVLEMVMESIFALADVFWVWLLFILFAGTIASFFRSNFKPAFENRLELGVTAGGRRSDLFEQLGEQVSSRQLTH